MKISTNSWIGWAALVVGIGAVVASIAVTSTRAGEGLTFGFAAFIAFFALMSLLARNRTPNHWGLVVIGLSMFLLPWLGDGFTPDRGAAWTAWIAGFLAMALGAVGWLGGRPPTVYGINENASPDTKLSAMAGRISWAALVVGVATVVLAATVVQSSPAALAIAAGLGVLTAVIAAWSLLAVDPTHDFWTLAIVGFALFLAPWMAGFSGDEAAWAAWVPGAIATAVGVTGYLRGESLDFAGIVRENADARYRERFRRHETSSGRPATRSGIALPQAGNDIAKAERQRVLELGVGA